MSTFIDSSHLPSARRRLCVALVLTLALGITSACSLTDPGTSPTDTVELTYTFADGTEGWTGAFADYPADDSSDMALVFERRPLADEVVADSIDEEYGLFLAGTNLSDDLFMYLKRRVDGLAPNTTYAITLHTEMASDAPSGCAGAGGQPGESVFFKFGAAPFEPVAERDSAGWYRLNLDHQDPDHHRTEHTLELGHIGNGETTCTGPVPFRMIEHGNPDAPFTMTTDEEGTLWLFLGTDSGFEGRTDLYYDTIRFTLAAQSG